MTRSELCQSMASETGWSVDVCRRVVDTIFEEISSALADGRRVELRDFGNFKPIRVPPRNARNPRTGEPVVTGPGARVIFNEGKDLFRRLNPDL